MGYSFPLAVQKTCWCTISAQDFGLLANPITLDATSTLAAWLWSHGPATLDNYSPIFACDQPGGGDSQIYYGDGGNPKKLTVIKSGARILISTSDLPAANAAWHLLIVTDDGAALKAYVDDVDIGNSVGAYTSMSTMRIVRTNQGINSNNFGGFFSQMAIWNVALSASERAALYNNGSGILGNVGRAPFNNGGLVAGWNFNEGFTTSDKTVNHTTADFSGGANTITLKKDDQPSIGWALWSPKANRVQG
jgi:hypothetical protein